MPWRPRCLLTLIAACVVCSAPKAHAQAEGATPLELFEQGYFEPALVRVDGLIEAGPSAAEMVSFLEVRALVHLALGRTDGLRSALGQLLAFAPNYEAPATASPDYAAEVERAKQRSPGPLAVMLHELPSGLLQAELVNDPGDLPLRAAIRTRSEGIWHVHGEHHQPAVGAQAVQGVVLGRRGVLLHEGPIRPLVGAANVSATESNALAEESAVPTSDGEAPARSSRRRRRIVLAVTLSLLVVAGVTSGVVLSRRGGTRYVPVVDW